MKSSDITQEMLKEMFDYRDGWLYYKVNRGNVKTKGRRFGSIGAVGGIKGTLFNRRHNIHRLIFNWHHGYYPEVVDHINNDPTDNTIDNLRGCSQAENMRNSVRRSSKARSKYKGVVFVKDTGLWMARLNINKIRLYKKQRKSEVRAAIDYNRLAIIHHKEFAKLNNIRDGGFIGCS